MVRLSKIYTRTGDAGETGLVGGARVPKHALRVETYGTVDEANSAIGIARVYVRESAVSGGQWDAMLHCIQHDLFDLGADLATREAKREALRVTAVQVERLEREIDEMNAPLSPLESFVLPGGSRASAYLHLARTVVRRAERIVCALVQQEAVNPLAVQYLNRLSDHLFVMARAANREEGDVLWQPGVNR